MASQLGALILDAMGGDYGPSPILEGATQALPELCKAPGELIILGDEAIIRPLLEKRKYKTLASALEQTSADPKLPFRVRLIHTPQNIQMDDSIRAIRSKPNATINVGCQLAGESYQKSNPPAAFISAGHSGAVMASALLHIGRLSQVERPAIAVKLPTLSPTGCIMIDVGANVDCRPEHLRDFAIMGAIFAQTERSSRSVPRVALLSNGEERKKGNELTRASLALIENLPCFQPGPDAIGKFVGYAEGKEIFKGHVDVVVTDGFVGNVVLKTIEGLGSAVTTILKSEARSSPLTILGFLLSAGVFARFKKRLDYAEYGAAPLLGVGGYVFICHGRSNPKAVRSALLRARITLQGKLVERLETALKNIPLQQST